MVNNFFRGLAFPFLLLFVIVLMTFSVRGLSTVQTGMSTALQSMDGRAEYHELKSGTRMVRLIGRAPVMIYCQQDGAYEISAKGASEEAVKAICEKVWAPEAVNISAGK